MRAVLLCWLLPAVLAIPAAEAQALRLPAPPAVRFAPEPGAQLPLGASFTGDDGNSVRLGALFGSAPVVLVPGYYTCPNLCSTVFEGVVQALALSGLRAGEYRLVGLSVDSRDTPARAAAKKRAYAAILPGGAQDLQLLTGSAASIAALTGAIGYSAQPERAGGELAHAAGFVVAGPDGRVASFFPGVRFEPAALRTAVQSARSGRAAGFGQQLLLLCAHYDPALGRHSAAALAAVRTVALAVLLALAGWAWRRHRGGRR
jgi:protein SCO1/2